jgi:hypothetical protein
MNGIQLTTLVAIDTDCIGSCKSNYHTIMITHNYIVEMNWNLNMDEKNTNYKNIIKLYITQTIKTKTHTTESKYIGLNCILHSLL